MPLKNKFTFLLILLSFLFISCVYNKTENNYQNMPETITDSSSQNSDTEDQNDSNDDSEEDSDEEQVSLYNRWFKYCKEGGIDIPLGANDSNDSETTMYLENAELYVYYDENTGLKAAVQSDKTENVQLYQELMIVTEDVTVGSTKQYTKEEFGSAKFYALILSGYFTQCEAPKIVAHPEECFIIQDDFENVIQWRKVLANILIFLLLEE